MVNLKFIVKKTIFII